MSTTTVVLILVLAIIVVAAGWMYYRQQRRKALRAHFGPEYTHAVKQYGNQTRAEEALSARQRRLEKLHIVRLEPADQQRFLGQWQIVQRDFVDDPAASIQRADALVSDVLRARGYPVSDFEHRAEDISVDHPDVVQNFRAAHAIAERHKRGEASTEDLRQALVHYRELFDDLLESHPVGRKV
jgi:hypothetical protein